VFVTNISGKYALIRRCNNRHMPIRNKAETYVISNNIKEALVLSVIRSRSVSLQLGVVLQCSYCIHDRQCMYIHNVTLRRVRAAIVAAEK
jgi:hypothetical protein